MMPNPEVVQVDALTWEKNVEITVGVTANETVAVLSEFMMTFHLLHAVQILPKMKLLPQLRR
jgi:hypothetical protein